ncbi:MAG: ral secretion pathway protein GspG [Rhodocyclaceae bacterium]|nr:ral secretion pathway protein GspG [Rhodocyclaceae bacterium]
MAGFRPQAGFTLIEVVITVVIVGLLAGIAMPLTETVVRRSKEQELKAALMALRNALDAYKDAADAGRIERKVGDSGYPPSLEVLVAGVADRRQPTGARLYFLRRIPRDPFGDPGLPPAQTWSLRSYDSPPDSPRSGKDVFDVYSQAEGRALDGTLYRDW